MFLNCIKNPRVEQKKIATHDEVASCEFFILPCLLLPRGPQSLPSPAQLLAADALDTLISSTRGLMPFCDTVAPAPSSDFTSSTLPAAVGACAVAVSLLKTTNDAPVHTYKREELQCCWSAMSVSVRQSV